MHRKSGGRASERKRPVYLIIPLQAVNSEQPSRSVRNIDFKPRFLCVYPAPEDYLDLRIILGGLIAQIVVWFGPL